MKEGYNKKYLNIKALDIDTPTKQVKIAVSEMGTVDLDKELIVPTAWNKTIKERGPAGSNQVWHLLDHGWSSFDALSKPKEIFVQDGKYLVFVSQYKDNFAWREVAWPLYEGGDFTEHSVGYTVVSSNKLKDYTELTELMLWEGSAVLWGANRNTPTLSVEGKSLLEQKEDVHSRLNRIIKAVDKKVYGDDNSLLVIQLKQLQHLFSDLKNITLPSEEPTTPIEEKKLDTAIQKNISDLYKLFV